MTTASNPYPLKFLSSPNSSTPPTLQAENLPAGTFVQVLLGAGADCSSGQVIDVLETSSSGQAIALSGPYPQTSAGFRILATLPDSTQVCSNEVVQTGVISTEYRQLAIGGNGSFYTTICGLTSSGKVRCWGDDTSSKLDNGPGITHSAASGEISAISGATSVSVGQNRACAIAGGVPTCWGNNAAPSPYPLTNAVQTVSGYDFDCFLFNNGTVQCVGTNTYGQLGNGNNTDSATPVLVSGLSSVASLHTGHSSYNVCALTSDQKAYCWGYNGYGQFGDGTIAHKNTPFEITGFGAINDISVSDSTVCFVTATELLYCSGRNNYSQLGDGTTTNRTTFAQVAGLTAVKAVTVSANATCATIGSNRILHCWGDNFHGTTSPSGALTITTPQVVLTDLPVDHMAMGGSILCIGFADFTIQCRGSNYNGAVGDRVTISSSSGAKSEKDGNFGLWPSFTHSLRNIRALKVATGDNANVAVCAITAQKTVMCWGQGGTGALGSGTLIQIDTPTTVPGLSDVEELSGGGHHFCALKSDSTVWCWGWNNQGQIGNNSTTQQNTPIQITGFTGTPAHIEAGDFHTCAIMTDQTVNCWGRNTNYILGDGTNTQRLTPVLVTGVSNVLQVAANYGRTCALISGGTVTCWGWPYAAGTKVVIGNLANAVEIYDSPQDHHCARLSDGTAKCWGDNYYYQLGDGTDTDSYSSAVTVTGLTNVAKMAIGSFHTCAILNNGAQKCWGFNDRCQADSNCSQPTYITSPYTLPGIGLVIDGTGLYRSQCAVLRGGSVKCWGQQPEGEHGLGGWSRAWRWVKF